MKLYEEIIFLKHYATCPWIVENVKPYYGYLIEPNAILMRHPIWSNFEIPHKYFEKDNIRKAQIPQLSKKYGYDLSKYKLSNKRQVLRNCVEPEIGQYILSLIQALTPDNNV